MHPLAAIPGDRRRAIFLALLAATLVVMLALQVDGQPLKTSQAPAGIVTFELAGTPSKAQAILDSWDNQLRLHAAFNLGLDYLFMPLYSTTIALGCLWAADQLRRKPDRRDSPLVARLGGWLAWGLWLAAISDAVENIALLRNLYGQVSNPLPEIARICAILKFGLILLGIAYMLLGLAFRFTGARHGSLAARRF